MSPFCYKCVSKIGCFGSGEQTLSIEDRYTKMAHIISFLDTSIIRICIDDYIADKISEIKYNYSKIYPMNTFDIINPIENRFLNLKTLEKLLYKYIKKHKNNLSKDYHSVIFTTDIKNKNLIEETIKIRENVIKNIIYKNNLLDKLMQEIFEDRVHYSIDNYTKNIKKLLLENIYL
jgi:hypothetical protein